MNKDEHLQMLKYFYEEKGDMKRYCAYEEAIELFPKLKQLELNLELAENALDDYFND